MSIYTKIGEKILANPNIIRPHVKTKDISQLNFKKMKDMGMEKIIFSKDNTLTLTGGNRYIKEDTDRIGFTDALKVFGQENLFVMTDLTETASEKLRGYNEADVKEMKRYGQFREMVYDYPTDK